MDIIGFPINSLDLVCCYDSDWGGYVYNHAITNENKKDDWEMGLNLIHAYEKYGYNSGNKDKRGYNSQGTFGYVMIHEFGFFKSFKGSFSAIKFIFLSAPELSSVTLLMVFWPT